MNDLLNTLAREQLKADLPEIRPGDTVRVSVRVVEGNRDVGVERTFMVHSPRVEKIELIRHGHARRAALYFLRDRVGKAATLREKRR